MPTTYNGIGTHYCGKRNLSRRKGTCSQCGRAGELASYDTRLWFVVFFIPVIPLGRKHILDYCPSCTRHYAMDADKWETAKQLEVSGALEKYRANPTPEDAVAAHQQLINFQQFDQAAEFRKLMQGKHGENAKVQAYLGAVLEHLGQTAESYACFTRALALRPDLPEARVGVAMGHVRAGRLDEAHKLLEFLEEPGSSRLYSLEPLDRLARACQNMNRHDDALAIFATLQKELPRLAEEKWFRRLVAKSEKDSGRRDSQLPKLKFSWKRLFSQPRAVTGGGRQVTWRGMLVLGIILALVALGFVVSNEYIRRHRTIHIVNGHAQPVSLRIEGVADLTNVRGVQEIILPEGHYRAIFGGAVQREVEFDVRSTYFSRWFSNPAWVLNPGGAAILIRSAVVYSSNPRPPTVSFHFGKDFEHFAGVTHPFEPLPESLSLHQNEERTLVHLDQYRGEGIDVFYYLQKQRTEAALTFAEHWLRAHAGDNEVIRAYRIAAIQTQQTNRLDVFLRSGLAERPVRIEWHRLYQGLHDRPASHAALVSEYDTLLRADPQNSALLYLRGRIEGNRTLCRDYFERACKADPDNAFAVFGLGYDRMSTGDWAAARPLLTRACELRPSDRGFQQWLSLTRLALGEAPAIEQEARQQIAADPLSFHAVVQLIEALAAQDRAKDVLDACTAFVRALSAERAKGSGPVINAIRRYAFYAVGDFSSLEKACDGDDSPAAKSARAEVLIEQNRTAEAAQILSVAPGDEDRPVVLLALAIACRLAGDAGADRWENQARLALANGDEESVQAAALLERTTPPTPVEVRDLAILPQLKSVLLAELALKHPQARAELAPLARRLNVERRFPFHLVQRATAERR